MESPEAYFYIVRQPTSLENITSLLYGSTDSAAARDFLRINTAAADGASHLAIGHILYIPDTVCYAPALEAHIIELVRSCNEWMRLRLSGSQMRLLARQSNLISNAASHSRVIESTPGMAGKAADGLLAATRAQARMIGSTLEQLEALYKKSYRANGGRLGPKFYAQRRRIYETLDSTAGRLARTITLGTRLDENARGALRIKTKSQLLHWKRRGTGGHLRDFEAHFQRMGRITRYLDRGGYLLIGVDAYLTSDAIAKACEAGDDRHCHRAMLVKGGGFVGRAGVGSMGGSLAYSACSLLFSIESAGSSFLWCGIVVGAAGSVTGGLLGNWVGKSAGRKASRLIFENTYQTRQP